MPHEDHVMRAADRMRRLQLWKAESDFYLGLLAQAEEIIPRAKIKLFHLDQEKKALEHK